MDYETAQHIWRSIRETSMADLRDDLVDLAIRYARIRVDWLLADPKCRENLENDRTACHNAFIAGCDILSRNMTKRGEDTSWREQLGNDRKKIGDFACLLHAILGISAR